MTRRWGSKRLSGRKARANAVRLCCSCTDERFAELTADELARTHNMTVKVAEQVLADARKARAA